MAGGSGTRFWPLSKSDFPKQFIDILGTGETLIQRTYRRFLDICRPENIYVVTNSAYKELVNKQLPGLGKDQVLCEPAGRNTGPCIAYACHKINRRNPGASLVVSPADHYILNEEVFRDVILSALRAAEGHDRLLTLGITPSRPDTGYGYIRFDKNTTFSGDARLKKVVAFTEKPVVEKALHFLKSGDYLWNSGIFVWSLQSILQALEKHLPDIHRLFLGGAPAYYTPAEETFIDKAYAGCRSISIDYGLMEKADNVYVLAADFGWSDVGTWKSLFEVAARDQDNNFIKGNDVMTFKTTNCVVNMPDGKLVVLHSLNNCIVVENDGILLICDKDQEQNIRMVVDEVKARKGDKYI
jgi:mannose-1-phosphate guanylyltransferase